ncbi:polygalacturonase-like [Manihot esculenta]|uniref:polygalacturonase-like n=1 Tax=Manihot esculenta TaxID=3983 RepID=UPI000B5D89E1|nr:polygalacturonase-like [Manihot esculenta]
MRSNLPRILRMNLEKKRVHKDDDPEDIFSLTSLLLLFVFAGRVQSAVFDVNNYGGKGDGKSEISKALLGAWKEACSATGSNRVVVPKGTYSIGLPDLNGPCKGAMELQDVTSLDSKNFHVNVLGGKNLTFDRFTITAPGHSINIDAIHIGHSNGIDITNSGIFVRNCTIYDTDNGERIKTWSALRGAMASVMHFEDIMMKNVRNPIVIDQMHCPWNH